MSGLLIWLLALTIISILGACDISYKKGLNKGIEQGREQVLNENVIRLKNDIERIKQEEEQLTANYKHLNRG